MGTLLQVSKRPTTLTMSSRKRKDKIRQLRQKIEWENEKKKREEVPFWNSFVNVLRIFGKFLGF